MSEEKNEEVEILDEYDFSNAVIGKYAKQYAEGTNIVVLEPDVAKVFPDSAAVNQALRQLIEQRYYRLVIEAQPQVDIWLADDDGHLVQKETMKLDTRLLPGHYVVEFGLGTQTYPIELSADSYYTQVEIEAGPKCPRPKVKLAPLYTAKQGQYLAFIYYFIKIHGIAPSEADLQRYFRVSPPSVHQMIVTLDNKGLIAREPGKERSIKLLLNRQEIPDLE